jgi:2-deoxy-D-gluconate 3-dehydrogenase
VDQSIIHLFDLAGLGAVVTGASGGLGRAMADALRDAGCRVVVVGRSERTLKMAGEGYLPVQSDLTQDGEPQRVIGEAIRALGRLDILVNSHGTVSRAPAEDFPLDQWNRIVATNLTSVFQTSQAAAKYFLTRRQGKIINVASMLSFSGGLRAAPYAASKGGVAQLTKALANEWAPHGVNVNAIAPGYFETNATDALRADPVRNQQILDRLPAGRWGQPGDLKGSVVFLASAASNYVHGIILPVDGGWLSR